jgi:hypothetical protein
MFMTLFPKWYQFEEKERQLSLPPCDTDMVTIDAWLQAKFLHNLTYFSACNRYGLIPYWSHKTQTDGDGEMAAKQKNKLEEIKHTAKRQGVNAARKDQSEASCPYPNASGTKTRRQAWLDGFKAVKG